jgi:hypothetical protein
MGYQGWLRHHDPGDGFQAQWRGQGAAVRVVLLGVVPDHRPVIII